MDYKPMIPETEFDFWESLKPKEAKEFFNYFIGAVPKILSQLQEAVEVTRSNPDMLDYSDRSLVELWKWYIHNMKKEDVPEEKIRSYCEEQATALTKIVRNKGGVITDNISLKFYNDCYNHQSRQGLKPPWNYISMDIGVYLGECFMRKYPEEGIHWGFFTKRRSIEVNRPILMGLMDRLNTFWDYNENTTKPFERNYDLLQICRRKAGSLLIKPSNEIELLDFFRVLEGHIYQMNSQENLTQIRDMDEEQARKYYEWFVYQINSNVKDLGMCDITDFSVESLPKVWERFLVEKVSLWENKNEELRVLKSKGKNKRDPYLRKRLINGVEIYEILHVHTLDISIYFAEVFRRNHEDKGIKWGYITDPKTLPYVNRPVLVGFGNLDTPVMDQIGIFSDLAVRVAKGERDWEALLKIYREWEKWI